MSKEIWFKKKRYGWGWTPANAKGWLVTLGYVVSVLAYSLLAKEGFFEFSAVWHGLITLSLTVGLIWVCYAKGEKPSWTWGDKER